MSQITAALNKVQRSREGYPAQKSTEPLPEPLYVKKKLQVSPQMMVAGSIMAGVVALLLISNELYHMQQSMNVQENQIKGLNTYLNGSQNLSESEIQSFDYRLKNEAQDRKIQIDHLALIDNAYYIDIVKSILSNSRQISDLDQYTKNLQNRIKKLSAVQ